MGSFFKWHVLYYTILQPNDAYGVHVWWLVTCKGAYCHAYVSDSENLTVVEDMDISPQIIHGASSTTNSTSSTGGVSDSGKNM